MPSFPFKKEKWRKSKIHMKLPSQSAQDINDMISSFMQMGMWKYAPSKIFPSLDIVNDCTPL